MSRPWARVTRILYYVCVVAALLLTVIVIPISFDMAGMSGVRVVGVMVVVTAICFLPAVVLHAVTRLLDRPDRRTRVEGTAAPVPSRPVAAAVPLDG